MSRASRRASRAGRPSGRSTSSASTIPTAKFGQRAGNHRSTSTSSPIRAHRQERQRHDGQDGARDEQAHRQVRVATPGPLEQPHDERERDVEGHLGGDAPRLRERVDVGTGQVRVHREGLGHDRAHRGLCQHDHHRERHPVGGQDASGPAHGVGLDVGAPVARVAHEVVVQQEAREGEEDRDPEVTAAHEPPEQPPVDGEAGQVGRVRRHDEERGHGAQPVEGGQAGGHGAHDRGRPHRPTSTAVAADTCGERRERCPAAHTDW